MSLSPNSPHRPLNWVWERAKEIRDGGSPFSKKMDGPWVAKTVKFQDRLSQARTTYARYEVEMDMPELSYAHDFWVRNDPTTGDPMTWELEGRILARQDDAMIAPGFATTPGVIEAYEKMFFHVRDRLNARQWVLHQAVGPELSRGLKLSSTSLIFKIFGYLGGPTVLDELVGFAGQRAHPINSAGVGDFFDTDMKMVLRMKSALVARTAPVNFMSPYDVMDRYHKLLDMERAAGGQGANTAIMYNLEQLFAACGSSFKVLDENDPCLQLTSGVGISPAEQRKLITDGKLPDSVQQDVDSISEATDRFRK